MNRYVDPTEQLVTEIMVRDIKRSTAFYRRLGFSLLRDGGGFVELSWEEHRLFLDERSTVSEADPSAPSTPRRWPPANIRVMVPNVDDYWRVAQDIGAPIVQPIADRSYGLRDFTMRVVDINALRALAPPRLRPRAQAITSPAPHAAPRWSRRHRHGYKYGRCTLSEHRPARALIVSSFRLLTPSSHS